MRVKIVVGNERGIVLENPPPDNVNLSSFALDSNFELLAKDDYVSG
jgi:hypothetical protein